VTEAIAPPIPFAQANLLQRSVRRLGAWGPGSWLFARILHHIDRPVHRLTRGRRTLTGLLAGFPVVMLTTTGARSGAARTVPVLGLPTDEGLVVVASSFGQARHPAWHHNLRANPDAVVAVDGDVHAVRAVEARGEQRARIWREGLTVYPGWSQYERRAAHREIAVYVLQPR
jgi:deazaflavin-dependent oxidoreductase (nitroreductase family)